MEMQPSEPQLYCMGWRRCSGFRQLSGSDQAGLSVHEAHFFVPLFATLFLQEAGSWRSVCGMNSSHRKIYRQDPRRARC